MRGSAQAIVEKFQPYHLGDAAETHPLWLLHELSNVDKHRTLLLTGAALERPDFSLNVRENIEIDMVIRTIGAIHDGEGVALVRLRKIESSQPWQGYSNMQVSPHVAFDRDGPGRGLPVHRTMTNIRQEVAEVLVALSRFL